MNPVPSSKPWRLALICPELSGHLNPATTLARELQGRGHSITVIARPDAEAKARRSGCEFVALGEREFPPGYQDRFTAEVGKLSGLGALRRFLAEMDLQYQVTLRELPARLRATGVDGVLVDQVDSGAATVAESLGLPFVTLCDALPLHPDPAIPPWNSLWAHGEGWMARLRNRLGYGLNDLATLGFERRGHRARARLGLPRRRMAYDGSPLAHVAQLPACFDFPRRTMLPHFHYTAPWHAAGNVEACEFPFHRLDGRPLIYASMGTLQNRQVAAFRAIATACDGLDAQLVLSFGRRGSEPGGGWPRNALVVDYAPQLELLRRASLVITHAGMNTTLEALAHGVPMVAIPVAYDQQGIAARIRHFGVGEWIRLSRLSPRRLRVRVERVLGTPSYRERARELQAKLAALDGVQAAVAVVELAFRTGRPVTHDFQPSTPTETLRLTSARQH